VLSEASRLEQTIRLADGRTLGYAEYGPADGPPVFLFHGLPGSRLAIPELWPSEPGHVRVIAPDRPGMGTSTFQPGRRLTDWADDIRQLADALGLGRFGVAGFSGGGPHALAVAHGLPGRVIAAGCLAGAGRFDTRAARQVLSQANPANRVIFFVARRTPALLWPLFAQHARGMTRHPAKVVEAEIRDKHLPEADRQAMADPRLRAQLIESAPEPFRQGVRGLVAETRLLGRPWGFDPAAIGPPVHLWHGDRDTNVPLAMARQLASQIPGSSLTIYPGEGHLIAPRHWDEIIGTLLS
jgi:pimeloyl-ACP methyl ester carboxylesterase